MLYQVKFPKIENLKQTNLVRYYVKDGQKVVEGQALAEIDAGIATFDVPCEKEGIVKQRPIPEGAPIHAGDIIVVLVISAPGDKPVSRFEYKTIGVSDTGFFGAEGIDPTALKGSLNILGAEGWELVTGIDPRYRKAEGADVVLVFKREMRG
ncbi:MAG TPA: DUF4177 domain-containing protein [Bacteroidetes bacterium]|nr:DUF4177 domain-containing protein [Bacteroidota bacterium]